MEQQLVLGSTKALVQSTFHDLCDALARDAIANALILEERREEYEKNTKRRSKTNKIKD